MNSKNLFYLLLVTAGLVSGILGNLTLMTVLLAVAAAAFFGLESYTDPAKLNRSLVFAGLFLAIAVSAAHLAVGFAIGFGIGAAAFYLATH